MPPRCQRAGQVWGWLLYGQGLLVLVQPSWCVYRHRELQASARRPQPCMDTLSVHHEPSVCAEMRALVLFSGRNAGQEGLGHPHNCVATLCLRGTQATAPLCDFGTSGQVTREQQAREGGGVWPSGDSRASHMVMCLLWGQNACPARRGRGRDRLTDVEQKVCNQTRRHNPPNVNSLQQYFSNLKWALCVQTRAACLLLGRTPLLSHLHETALGMSSPDDNNTFGWGEGWMGVSGEDALFTDGADFRCKTRLQDGPRVTGGPVSCSPSLQPSPAPGCSGQDQSSAVPLQG